MIVLLPAIVDQLPFFYLNIFFLKDFICIQLKGIGRYLTVIGIKATSLQGDFISYISSGVFPKHLFSVLISCRFVHDFIYAKYPCYVADDP